MSLRLALLTVTADGHVDPIFGGMTASPRSVAVLDGRPAGTGAAGHEELEVRTVNVAVALEIRRLAAGGGGDPFAAETGLHDAEILLIDVAVAVQIGADRLDGQSHFDDLRTVAGLRTDNGNRRFI